MADSHAQARAPGAFELRSTKGLLAFAAMAGVFLLADNVAHGFVHEVLGHGLAAMAFGMKFTGFYVTAFGNSYSFDAYPTMNLSLEALQLAAGSLVSAVAGFLVFLFVYPRVAGRSFGAGLFTILLCLNFETDLVYPFLSPIMRFGDAYQITQMLGVSPPWIISLVMVPVAIVGYYPMFREYLRLLVPHVGPIERLPRRLLVLGVAGFLPVFSYWLMGLVVLAVLSGGAVTTLWAEGVLLGIGLIIPSGVVAAGFVRGRDLAPPASEGEARLAFKSMRRYLLISIILIMVALVIFGPTLETSWGIHWGTGGAGSA